MSFRPKFFSHVTAFIGVLFVSGGALANDFAPAQNLKPLVNAPKLAAYKLPSACLKLLKQKNVMPKADTGCDPFEWATWHTTAGWPGTIVFSKGKVVLAPMAAPEINAKYAYTVGVGPDGTLMGNLTMTNTANEVSQVLFDISRDGREMLMMYPQGSEKYQRLTTSEANAQKAALQEAMRQPGFSLNR